jgi:hypothetical protein
MGRRFRTHNINATACPWRNAETCKWCESKCKWPAGNYVVEIRGDSIIVTGGRTK